ncbi:hypothetical protein KRR26_04975 [Corallococcus sp. M34]|nr:hypothetical protein [Citreicoccus inhibens]MBU8894942.1 hypothetical protein [Citreicoccus inhibens]
MNHTLDRWIQRATLAGLLALAAALVTVGARLYAEPTSRAQPGLSASP